MSRRRRSLSLPPSLLLMDLTPFPTHLNSDPYDPTATSPLESRALDSSLWEIAALQKHYLPSVSSLAKVFSEVFTKPRFGMEDFLDHTFVLSLIHI